jgi:hypothetical protein
MAIEAAREAERMHAESLAAARRMAELDLQQARYWSCPGLVDTL